MVNADTRDSFVLFTDEDDRHIAAVRSFCDQHGIHYEVKEHAFSFFTKTELQDALSFYRKARSCL